ncbi:hypothetical protein [Lutimonas sp.]|uniref:hypothetical protein n=1 Tax=Lutimonas sp. TaxID=1872403 RepID=UPI003D9AF809
MMLKRFSLFLMIFLFIGNMYAQSELNPYKYIIVPKQYDFLKKENQYRLNSYTKHLFAEEGYQVFYDDASFPEDLITDPCLGLRANVLNNSSAFTTKIFLVLDNCAGEEVFRSLEGKSKVKELDKTYIDALKKSFVSIEALNYVYDPTIADRASDINDNAASSGAVTAVAATTVVNQEKQESEPKEAVIESPDTQSKVSEKPIPAAAVVVPVAAEEKKVEETPEADTVKNESVARAFQNENISFLLLDQGAQLQAFVSQSKNNNYKPGELIGTFKKSSLPNVFKVSWKKPMDGVEETTAYFDDVGNLRVDVYQDGTLKTLTFTELK